MRRIRPFRPSYQHRALNNAKTTALNNWSAIFSLASSIATTAAFILALWAYFFSSLPEKLTEKFNSEIVGLNTQLTELRQEKMYIHQQNEAAHSELSAAIEEKNNAILAIKKTKEELQQQINEYLGKKSVLEDQLKTLKNENVNNQHYRDQYLKDTAAHIFGIMFTLKYIASDGDMKSYLLMAQDYPKYIIHKEYLSRYKAERSSNFFDNLLGNNSQAKMQELQTRINESYAILPRSWLSAAPNLRDGDTKNANDVEQNFLAWVHQNNGYQTGLDLIKSRIDSTKDRLQELPQDDRSRITKALNSYYKANSKTLSLPIQLNVTQQATPEEILTCSPSSYQLEVESLVS